MTLPRTGLGTTSLGAVGGARGTAAGAIRILVEFLTQYDSAAVKQLETDLDALGKQQAAELNEQNKSAAALATNEAKRVKTVAALNKELVLQGKNQKIIKAELKDITALGAFSKEGKARLTALDTQLGGNSKLVKLYRQQQGLLRQQLLLENQLAKRQAKRAFTEEARAGAQSELGGLQKLKSDIAPKLGGLALGAVGGIFGGALVGVGFAAAEVLLEKIQEGLLNLVDPSRQARDAIAEVGAAINSIAASDKEGDRLEAAKQFLQDIGISADENTAKILAEAAALEAANKALETRKQTVAIVTHLDTEQKKVLEDLTRQLIMEAYHVNNISQSMEGRLRGTGEWANFAAEAERTLANAENAGAAAARNAATEARLLESARRQQAAAAQLAAFAEEQLGGAIQRVTGMRTGAIDDQIAGVQAAGPSRRTKSLEDQIERLQNAGSGGNGRQRQQELANIAEERALILLRQRLRLLGTNINLEKYSGKFLLEAIHAKQKALEKEAAAQERLTRLLDLQYRMAQKIQRNEGESINDFLERRAQENRGFLEEQRELEREKTEERLAELEEKTADEVKLQELAERKKTTAVVSGTNNRIRQLQKQLAASRAADAAATKAKVAALEKQKKAYEKSAADAEHYAKESTNAQIREALRAVTSIQGLMKLSGQAAGLSAAKTFLQNLLSSGVLTPAEAARVSEAIERITGTLQRIDKKADSFATRNGRTIYKEGGLVRLNNASTPFGANVRAGEEGDEYALIMQHKFSEGIKQSMKSPGDTNVTIYRSDDWFRDRDAFRKVVREEVARALR